MCIIVFHHSIRHDWLVPIRFNQSVSWRIGIQEEQPQTGQIAKFQLRKFRFQKKIMDSMDSARRSRTAGMIPESGHLPTETPITQTLENRVWQVFVATFCVELFCVLLIWASCYQAIADWLALQRQNMTFLWFCRLWGSTNDQMTWLCSLVNVKTDDMLISNMKIIGSYWSFKTPRCNNILRFHAVSNSTKSTNHFMTEPR